MNINKKGLLMAKKYRYIRLSAKLSMIAFSAIFVTACGGGGRQSTLESSGINASRSKVLANGGVHNLSSFSRANCVNNESITWDYLLEDWWMAVDSLQENDLGDVVFESCEVYGSRCAAVNWGGGLSAGSWRVDGIHYVTYFDESQRQFLEGHCDRGWAGSGTVYVDECKLTTATACNISEW